MNKPASPTASGPTADGVLSAHRQAQAERFIEQSQDGVAIRTLATLRRQPQSFMQRLREAATHNQTLRLALGICAGIVAAEAITGLMRGPALDQAGAQVDAWLQGVLPVSDAATPSDGISAGLNSVVDTAQAESIASELELPLDLDIDLGDLLS